jgi:hypothetical protein
MNHTTKPERERRVIPSIRIRKTPRSISFGRYTFWNGDLIRYSTPWLSLVLDYRTDFQMMSDMIGDLKRGQER